jgi:soluble lytic murein transglycosylase
VFDFLLNINFRKHRIALIIIGLIIVTGTSVAPFLSASCRTLHQAQSSSGETQALTQLRAMTRGGVLPADVSLLRIEAAYPSSKAAGLARILRAQIKFKAGDANAAAALLNSTTIRTQTAINDYALLLRARALEQAGHRIEARAALEQLARDYPTSLRARDAQRHDAEMLLQDNQAAAAPVLLQKLTDANDAGALLLAAKAYEQLSDQGRALSAYRRIYFYAPASAESADAASSIARLNSTLLAPATADEAIKRADKLYDAKRYNEAAVAYADAFARFPNLATQSAQLRRGITAANAKRFGEAVAALNSVPASAGETRAQALYYLAQSYGNARQWDAARVALGELRRAFPQSSWTPRAFTNTGLIAENAKNLTDAFAFFRTVVDAYPGRAEVAQAQFELAWAAHQAKNYQESSRLLIEHLALYADKNTDNRGRAGYWAARDSERAGKFAEARALYQAMQARYDANWYGYLAKQRLDAMSRNRSASSQAEFAPESLINRAIANLQTVSMADEVATTPNVDERITKADQLSNIGFDDYALDELNDVSPAAPNSPRINLAIARILRTRGENVEALNVLKRSFPDYSQMKPEELTREEWDVFYPLAYWNVITEQARLRRLDPHQLAGVIRQETVFNPHAVSSARAYGLMQLLVETATRTARKYGIDEPISSQTLFEPRLNIQLGAAYLRDQLDKFGRIEYVAAAYNAGPGRVVQWRASLPLEIDEWAEAIPFKETRGYVQGIVRNTLQYERLYDDNGQFLPTVGTRAVRFVTDEAAPRVQPADQSTRPRRTGPAEDEE